MSVSWILLTFLLLLAARTTVQLLLDGLNLRHSRRHEAAVPTAFAGIMDEETYARAHAYTRAKLRFSMVETVYGALVLAVVVVWLLAPLYRGLTGLLGSGVWGQAAVLFAVGVILSLPGLPFNWYEQFRLEERFGFNKSTLKLWLVDRLKGLVLGMLIGIPLLALVLAFFDWFPQTWWVWAFLALFAFQIVMMVVYPIFILPWFNKLSPLEDGALRERLLALADRTGFRAQTIQVMDGSKRSGHSNAFFTGFGRFRRIVLFDTLMNQLKPEALEAVLAHEIGHYRLGHIPKLLGMAALTSFLGFAAMGWLARQPAFLTAFGFDPEPVSAAPILLLFSLCSGVVTFWFAPLTNRLSRKHEYAADRFAREAVDGPDPLIEALRTLSRENLSNLMPHPVYSAFYYSHPTLLEREQSLKAD
ncbi:MAG: M48 family metallopeptidase [Opitutales bacterium]